MLRDYHRADAAFTTLLAALNLPDTLALPGRRSVFQSYEAAPGFPRCARHAAGECLTSTALIEQHGIQSARAGPTG